MMDDDQIVERVKEAVFDAYKPMGSMLAPLNDQTAEFHGYMARIAQAALAAHKTALAELDEAVIESIVKADFIEYCVYGGYTREAKESQWQRMRGIELRSFRRRWRAMLGAVSDQC
jgi:hypothetical protein